MLKVQDGNLQLLVGPDEARWIVVQILTVELEKLMEDLEKEIQNDDTTLEWKLECLGYSYKYKEALETVIEVFGRNDG